MLNEGEGNSKSEKLNPKQIKNYNYDRLDNVEALAF